MKKHLLLLSLVCIAITAHGQNSIPNGNFETWTSGTFDYPQNYPFTSNTDEFFQYHLPFNVTKITDAYHGTYAVQLTTNASATDTAFAFLLNKNPNTNNGPNTWTGGMPYNQKPKGIRGYYKYNVATADSATILVAFSKAGSNIRTYFLTIGGIHNTYTLFNLTFKPALTVTPDSVIFAAISCKLLNGQQPHGPAGSTLKLDSVSFTGVSSQPALMNGDFESWQSQTYNNPANWYVQSDNGNGFNRTTDAVKGNYAIELKTFPGNVNNHPAAQPTQISNGFYPKNCNQCYQMGGYPYSHQTDTLAFYYKYTPANASDSAWVSCSFKKNGINIWFIGKGLHATASYQYVEIPFNIFGQTPDTAITSIQSSSWNDTSLSYVGADLKIDEIHFKSQPLTTSIFNYENDNTIHIFPNPSNGKIQIQCSGLNVQSLEIYNMLAEKVYSTTKILQQILNEIDLSRLQKGIYFVKFYNEEKIYTKKIIIQ